MTDATTEPAATDRLRHVRLSRHLGASADRAYRAWADPEEFARWFPRRIEGSLAPGARSTLIFSKDRVWIDVVAAEPGRRFAFRWPWLPDDSCITTATIALRPEGSGCRLDLEDGPFDISDPKVLDAYAEALAGWGEALTLLRATLDFSVDLRPADF